MRNSKERIDLKPIAALFGFVILGFHGSASAAEAACVARDSDALAVTVTPARVLRAGVPPGLFGFTVDWFRFQLGHFRNGNVRPETIAWLKPFSGATYRYSGGNAMEWKNAVGASAARQDIYANNKGMAHPEFGPKEFFSFLGQVQGKGVVLLNIVGPKNKASEPAVMMKDNLDYLSWLSANGPRCVGGANCPISYFELGNEVDWESMKWTASDYSQRVLPLITTAKSKYPQIKFAAMGKTAPWRGALDSEGKDFDAVLAERLAKDVDAVTIHPYYDGMAIPAMQSYIAKLAKKYRTHNPKIDVLVTEHGRWPTVPATGHWSVNWYQASGSGGGLSTADFMLMLMNEKKVSGAMWHTISVTGPWQLFHLNKTNDSLYPSAVYWSLRTLREGFLTDTVEVTPALKPSDEYAGGYDTRLVAMANKAGNISLMGVNRSARAKAITMKIDGAAFTKADAQIRIMQGDATGSDNSEAQPDRFVMKTSSTAYSVARPSAICIPPKSTFSIVMGPQAKVASVDSLSAGQKAY